MRLVDAASEVLGKWRDHRINIDEMSGSTVNRDLNLLSNVLATAAKEWKWIAASPTTDVRRPKESEPRDRRYSDDSLNHRLKLGVHYTCRRYVTRTAMVRPRQRRFRHDEICVWGRRDDGPPIIAHDGELADTLDSSDVIR